MFYKWLLFLFFLPLVLFSQGINSSAFYTENGLWGIGTQEKPITPATYDTLIATSDGTYFIARKHKALSTVNTTGLLSEKGKVIIPHQYLNIVPGNGAFLVSQWVNGETRFGVLSNSNEVVLSTRFKAIQPLREFWMAKSQSNELKLYNQVGSIICGVDADSLVSTNNLNYFYTYKDGRKGLLSTSGREVIPPQYAQIENRNGEWIATPFPTWEIIQESDSSIYTADSIRIWNNTLIMGYGNLFYLEKDNQRISKTYDAIWPTPNNLAVTKVKNGYGALSIAGKEVLPNRFQFVYVVDGYLYAQKDSYWSLYDSLGVKKTVFTYDSIGTASEGLFSIQRKGKWGFMNRQGVEVIHCIYDTSSSFKNGKSIIRYFNREGIIDHEGNWVVKPIYDDILSYSFDFYIARLGYQYFMKNYEGEIIYFSSTPIPASYNPIIEQTPDGYIKEFAEDSIPKNGWKIINVNGKYGFEGWDGLLKITYRYDSLLPFSEELAAFKLRGKWGFINRYEQIVVQPHFSEVSSFSKGLSKVKQNGKYGLINKQGGFILKPKYENLKPVNENLWLVTEEGKKGLYDSSGAIILHPLLDNVIYVDYKHIIVKKNGKYGLVDVHGASILPRIYDYIGYDKTNKILMLKKNPEKKIVIN